MNNKLERKPILPLNNLSDRHRGLTSAISNAYTEAARVCLDRHHIPPVNLSISHDDEELDAIVIWEPTDERQKAAWANELDATRDGAYACALAAIELTKGMVAVRRAETKTGADYYIAKSDDIVEDLENCYRLEVSGVDKGSQGIIEQRVHDKLIQAKAGLSNLPAIAGVVGFKAKLVILQRLKK